MRYTCLILFSLLLTGCRSTEKPHPAAKKSGDLKSRLEFDYTDYFSWNQFKELEIGDLLLPSGKIVAGDPFFLSSQVPFSRKVPPGKYPVKLLLDEFKGNRVIAFAKIQFDPAKAVRWEMAVTEDATPSDIESLEDGEFIGYGVDGGLGCFADAESTVLFSAAMDDYYKTKPTGNYYDDVLLEEFEKAAIGHPLARSAGQWCNLFLKGRRNNVVFFTSGYGDGHYPSYWGFDTTGRIVELITDFLLLDAAGY